MTDSYSIEHSTRTEMQVLHSNLRWTLTTGQFSANQQHHSNWTADQKEKKKKPSLRIFENFCQCTKTK